MTVYTGDSGDNLIVGSDDDNSFSMSQGGVDTVIGGAGGDNFFFGATLTADDRIDGGGGLDYLHIQGDYSAGLTFAADTFVNIEGLVLDQSADASPVDYNITTVDGNVAAGTGLYILSNGHTVFDGSAETDGVFSFEAHTSGDQVTGGAGDDVFVVDAAFTRADQYDGGAGNDLLQLTVGMSGTIHNQNMVSIDHLVLVGGQGAYDLDFTHGVVAEGAVMQVDVGSSAAEAASLDFSSISGAVDLTSGAGFDHLVGSRHDDTIVGGVGADTIQGGGGGDHLTGSGGADVYVYTALSDSRNAHRDVISHLTSQDTIDLSAIDADTTTDGDQAFHQVAAFTHAAGELVLSFDGTDTSLQVDVDGDGKADMTVMLDGDRHDFTHFAL